MSQYYVYLNEIVQGPYELDYIHSMGLDGDTKICPEGSTEWVSLNELSNQGSINLAEFTSSDSTPSRIDKYEILREIGRGGMGSVYLAMDEVLNRKVAIKELKIDEQKKKDPEAYNILLRRFKKEAQVLAQLNHKNIVSVFDIIDQNQNQYIIMEYLNGQNLEELLNIQGVFSLESAVSVVSDTCLALDYIHKKSIIHRDIKPSNIIILEDDTVKLTDFGVTRDLNSSTMTQDGSLVGTIAYASPEQDSRDLDGRSDIFSLGVVLYELATGQKPFTGDTIASVLLKIATKDPVKPSEVNPKVHKMLENIILKAMSKSLGKRYATAMDMYNDLQSYKEALASNNIEALSGIKSNESLYNTDVRVDSIPPGKMRAKDILGQTMPPGKMQSVDLLGQSIIPGKPSFQEIKPLSRAPANVGKPEIINPTQIKPEVISEQATQVFPENKPEVKETEPVKQQPNKLQTKDKVSERIISERKEAIREIAVPSALIFIVLLGYLFHSLNFWDSLILIVTISVSYYDYHTANVSKMVSYFLMLISMFIIFVWLKEFIPAFQNSKIEAAVYYLLDFSLLLISFIGAFFVLKILDFISMNKNKLFRSVGGVIKSTLAFLSIILIVSSTDLIKVQFIKNAFEKSRVTNILSATLPDIKIGKKINISFGRFGLKISR